jgi:hypothetical protein
MDDLQDILSTRSNPEIKHYQAYTHPGVNWYIKTVLPDNRTDDSAYLNKFWDRLEDLYPKIIRITDLAFDWNGNRIDYCRTIWLRKEVDIIVTFDNGKLDYSLIDYDEGLNISAKNLINETEGDLKKAMELIASFTPESVSDKKRKNFKVIDNEPLDKEDK